MEQALRIRQAFESQGCPFMVESWTNQQFPILPNAVLKRFDERYAYSVWEPVDQDHTAVRFCTSWATTDEQVEQLIRDIPKFLAQ